MLQYLREIKSIAGKENSKFIFIAFIFIIQAQLELIGISLIAPYISLVIDYENGLKIFNPIITFFDLDTTRSSFLTLVSSIATRSSIDL